MEFVERVHEALGLPRPFPEDRVREDDMQMFPSGQFALATGVPEGGVLRSLRVYGENLRRIAQAESQFFHTYVEEPMLAAGMAEGQLLEISSQVSPQLRAQVEAMISWLYHRHQEHSIIEHVVGHVEEALEGAGVGQRRQARPPAMAFLDLTGEVRQLVVAVDVDLVGLTADVHAFNQFVLHIGISGRSEERREPVVSADDLVGD